MITITTTGIGDLYRGKGGLRIHTYRRGEWAQTHNDCPDPSVSPPRLDLLKKNREACEFKRQFDR
jgi:hypothetical protein